MNVAQRPIRPIADRQQRHVRAPPRPPTKPASPPWPPARRSRGGNVVLEIENKWIFIKKKSFILTRYRSCCNATAEIDRSTNDEQTKSCQEYSVWQKKTKGISLFFKIDRQSSCICVLLSFSNLHIRRTNRTQR